MTPPPAGVGSKLRIPAVPRCRLCERAPQQTVGRRIPLGLGVWNDAILGNPGVIRGSRRRALFGILFWGRFGCWGCCSSDAGTFGSERRFEFMELLSLRVPTRRGKARNAQPARGILSLGIRELINENKVCIQANTEHLWVLNKAIRLDIRSLAPAVPNPKTVLASARQVAGNTSMSHVSYCKLYVGKKSVASNTMRAQLRPNSLEQVPPPSSI